MRNYHGRNSPLRQPNSNYTARIKLYSSNQTTQLELNYTARTKLHSSNQITQLESNYTAHMIIINISEINTYNMHALITQVKESP